ncbi:MAG: hypothetical protein MZU95_09450 [Desulfomicrobium escambiense]|nr:hypothetical protein [Desulfomicrobium escambiense]
MHADRTGARPVAPARRPRAAASTSAPPCCPLQVLDDGGEPGAGGALSSTDRRPVVPG